MAKYLDLDGLAYYKSKEDLLLANKVDKETGKGLSTNDYTTAEKTKLSGIETAAEVNVLEGVQLNGITITPTNKIANIEINVPTSTSELTNDSGFITNTVNNLTNYYTKTQTDNLLDDKADSSDIPTKVSDLTNDVGYSTFSGSYNDLTNKPTIPTKTSDLTNDTGFIDNTYHDSSKQDTLVTGVGIDITNGVISNTQFSGSTTQAEGTNVTIENTIEGPISSELKGDTTQFTTTGKNLFDTTLYGTKTSNGITLTTNEDGTYTLNGTSTVSGYTDFNLRDAFSIVGTGEEIVSANVISGAADKLVEFQLCQTSFFNPLYINVKNSSGNPTYRELVNGNTYTTTTLRIGGNCVCNNLRFSIQVEKGTTPTSFEKYTGGIASPNPDYPQEVEVVTGENIVTICGKNVFNIAKLENSGWQQPNVSTRLVMFLDKVAQRTKMSVTSKDTTNYRFSVGFTKLGYASRDNIIVNESGWQTTSTYTATASGEGYPFLQISRIDNGNISASEVEGKFQFEYSDTPTTYEAYKGQTYEINLGKNLLDTSNARTDKTWLTRNSDGSLTLNYPSGSNANFTDLFTNNINIPTGNYVLKIFMEGTFVGGNLIIKNINGNNVGQTSIRNGNTITITNSDIGNIQFYVVSAGTNCTIKLELEKGRQATEYAPYKSPIELCKIGNYQDRIYKDSGKWYLHKEIGKVVLDGTNNAFHRKSGQQGNCYEFKTTNFIAGPESNIVPSLLSNKFVPKSWDDKNNYLDSAIMFIYQTSTSLVFRFGTSSSLTTLELANAWLVNNNITLYGILATPTNTEITDTELINQLDTLASARSYTGQTNISVDGDLPVILDLEAYINNIPTKTSDLTNDSGFITSSALDGYVPTSRTINSKALTNNITLSASDVGALSSSTTYVSSVNGSSGDVTGLQTTSNLSTSIDETSTDTEYPSAKVVYDSQVEQNEKIEELERYKTIYNVLPKVEDEGEALTLNDTGNATLKMDLKGNTTQFTTTGKNLFDNSIIINKTLNGLTITNDNGLIKIVGTATGGTNLYYNIDNSILDLQVGETYTLSSIGDATGIGNMGLKRSGIDKFVVEYSRSDNKTITVTESLLDYNQFSFFIPSGSSVNASLYIQLEKGSTTTDYEPYVGGTVLPNPNYPQEVETVTGNQEIVVCGKNIFDKDNPLTDRYYDSNGEQQIVAGWFYNNQEIALSNKYTITFSKKTGSPNVRVVEFGDNDIFIQRTMVTTNNTTITINENTTKVIVSVDDDVNHNNYFENLQIEKGNQATTYEPYQKQTYPINLGNIELCKIGDYQDRIYKDSGKWYIEKKIGKVVLNGSEDWGTRARQYCYSIRTIGFISTINDRTIVTMMSNYAEGITTDQSDGFNKDGIAQINGNRLAWNNNIEQNNNFADLTTFKTWLSTHNTIVYYVLATPTTTEITDTTLISQLDELESAMSYKGQTNISQINNDAPFIISASALYDLNNLVTRVAILETE